jgi:hypothetical protein
MEYTSWRIREFTMITGKRIICMDRVNTSGLMVGSTKEDMQTTKKMVMEYIIIQMADTIKACGKMGNSMEKKFSLVRMVLKERENGRMGNVYFG